MENIVVSILVELFSELFRFVGTLPLGARLLDALLASWLSPFRRSPAAVSLVPDRAPEFNDNRSKRGAICLPE